MRKTFDTVEDKIAEAEFFLRKMSKLDFDIFEFNCYFSAFLSATRTTTLALQQFKHLPGFEEWYPKQQAKLKSNKLAKIFLKIRNEHVHGGPAPISSASIKQGKTSYYLDKRYFTESDDCQDQDVLSLSREYFILLLKIIYDCYVTLGVHINPYQYFTKEHFASLGKNIECAECEVWGFPRTSLIEEGYTEDDRWDCLRGKVKECKINYLFYSYLDKVTPQPIVPEHYQDFEDTPEDKGWVYAPAGFDSIEEYNNCS